MIEYWMLDPLELLDPFRLRRWQESLSDAVAAAISELSENSCDAVIDIRRLQESLPQNGMENGSLFRSCAYKFQGTDGVRGFVTHEELSDLDAVQAYVRTKTISVAFVRLYVRSFVEAIESSYVWRNDTILFAEDGRDHYSGGRLKNAVLQGVTATGRDVLDIGIVPTPVLVYESIRRECPAIMLTASHNPACHNGLKMFVNGRKLYPEGPCGEYSLTKKVLDAVVSPVPFAEVRKGKIFSENAGDSVGKLLDLTLDKEKINRFLTGRTIFLDTANGAYSGYAETYLKNSGATVVACDCSPGEGMINKDCGVGTIENMPEKPLPSDVKFPRVLKALLHADAGISGKRPYAIVLDGDGDRAFLACGSGDGTVRILDGDHLASLIIEGSLTEGRTGLFACTVESDYSLPLAVEERAGWNVDVVCVGDRWLVDSYDRNRNPRMFVGCERSGHIIVPVETGNATLLSGNGMLTALLALQEIEEQNDKEPLYRPGRTFRTVWRDIPLDGFARGTAVWNSALRELVNRNPFHCCEILKRQDADMMFFELFEKKNGGTDKGSAVGCMFLRKSGTESKMTFTASLLQEAGDALEDFITDKYEILTKILCGMGQA